MVKIQDYEEFMDAVKTHSDDAQMLASFSNLLSFLSNGTFFRSKRVFARIRHQMQQVVKQSISNFSNDGSSSNDARLSAKQNNLA